jgi:hypothetical protein
VSRSEGFDDQAFFVSLCKKHHPHLRTFGYRKSRSVIAFLGLTFDLGPVGLLLFAILLFACTVWRDY